MVPVASIRKGTTENDGTNAAPSHNRGRDRQCLPVKMRRPDRPRQSTACRAEQHPPTWPDRAAECARKWDVKRSSAPPRRPDTTPLNRQDEPTPARQAPVPRSPTRRHIRPPDGSDEPPVTHPPICICTDAAFIHLSSRNIDTRTTTPNQPHTRCANSLPGVCANNATVTCRYEHMLITAAVNPWPCESSPTSPVLSGSAPLRDTSIRTGKRSTRQKATDGFPDDTD